MPELRRAATWSPFHTVVTSDPFRQALQPGPVLSLLLPAAVLALAALAVFGRRDLRLP